MKQFKALVFFLVTASFSASSQTLDEIINKHLDAMGGKEKLKTLNSLIMQASLSVQGNDIPLTMTQVHNKGQRVDISLMGMDNYVIQTPTEGWQFFPIQGQASPEATPAEVLKETEAALDIQSPLLDYAQKGHSAELLQKEDVEGVECFKIKIITRGGMEMTFFIDPSNYYIIKAITKTKASGQEQEQVQTFSDFRKLESGYVFPYSMTGFGPGNLTITDIKVNPQVDEGVFKKPG